MYCNLIVGEIDQAITYDKCNVWCHIISETGISIGYVIEHNKKIHHVDRWVSLHTC